MSATPSGFNYAPRLAEVLNLSPKSISRKLRGETQFTLDEAVTICKTFNISLDNIYCNNGDQHKIKHPLEIYIHDFTIEKEFQQTITVTLQAFKFAGESKSSKYFVASNGTPDVVYANHKWIARFYFIKWLYFNKGTKSVIPMSGISFSPEDKALHLAYLEAIKKIDRSIYILSIDMMRNVVNEIVFFFRLKHITIEEVCELVHDYHSLLDEMEEIYQRGFLPDTGKEIDIFYSEILLSNDMTVIDSDNIKFAVIYAYFLNPVVTKSPDTFYIIRNWLHSWIRSANIINMSGENLRYRFFEKQRKDLDLAIQLCKMEIPHFRTQSGI